MPKLLRNEYDFIRDSCLCGPGVYMSRQYLPVAIRYGSAPALGGQLLITLSRIAADLPMAFRRVGATLTRRRAVAGLLLALAALLVVPIQALSHPHPDGIAPSGYDCDHQLNQGPPYDFCHSPEFRPENDGVLTFYLTDETVLGTYFEDAMPEATDDDHVNRDNPTMVYTVRDVRGGKPRDRDQEPSDGQPGHAPGFDVNKFTDGAPRLRTVHDYNYKEERYELYLVACDGNYRRGSVKVIVINSRTSDGNGNGGDGNGGNGNGGNGNGEWRQREWRHGNGGNGNGGDGNGGNGNGGDGNGGGGNGGDGNGGGGNGGGGNGGGGGGPPPNTAPMFANSPTSTSATRSFPENTPPGVNIGAPVAATDADGDSLTYGLGGPDAGSFAIESSTGQLKTKAGVTYDYETKASYSVTVKATDSSNASDTITVTIVVTDVAEKPATPAAPTVRAPEEIEHQPVGNLDGAGPERWPAAYRLRRGIPPGHEWRLGRLAAPRHRHHNDDYGAQAAHRLSGAGAGLQRRVAE